MVTFWFVLFLVLLFFAVVCSITLIAGFSSLIFFLIISTIVGAIYVFIKYFVGRSKNKEWGVLHAHGEVYGVFSRKSVYFRELYKEFAFLWQLFKYFVLIYMHNCGKGDKLRNVTYVHFAQRGKSYSASFLS